MVPLNLLIGTIVLPKIPIIGRKYTSTIEKWLHDQKNRSLRQNKLVFPCFLMRCYIYGE